LEGSLERGWGKKDRLCRREIKRKLGLPGRSEEKGERLFGIQTEGVDGRKNQAGGGHGPAGVHGEGVVLISWGGKGGVDKGAFTISTNEQREMRKKRR